MSLTLSPSELSDLKIIQRNVAGTPCYVKVTCTLMLAKNCPPSCVSDFLGIDTSTMYRYLATFTSGGLDSLLETRHKGYWGMLDADECFAYRAKDYHLTLFFANGGGTCYLVSVGNYNTGANNALPFSIFPQNTMTE